MTRLHLDAVTLTGSRTLVDDLTQGIGAGEMWCITGPNGAGKTTLINVLAGITRPALGKVTLDGRALDTWCTTELAQARALMPQATHDAFSTSVLDTVLLNRFPNLTGWGWESADDHAAAHAALDRLGLGAFASRDSECQRVALAAVLCQNAPLLLLDEPLSQSICIIRSIASTHPRSRRDDARTVIFTCHDLNLAHRFSTHALLLDGSGGAFAGRVDTMLTPERASAAFGYPLALIRDGTHEALVPSIPH